MSLLPESASFEELVQDYFLAMRGSGLMLSALDAELLTSWAEQGVPFEVVARGIARSAEKALWDARPGEPVLRSLRACRKQVEAEIKKHRERSAGAGSEGSRRTARTRSWEELRHAQLQASLERLAEREPGLAPQIHRLMEAVLHEVPTEFARMEAQESLVGLVLLRALPFSERRGLWRSARGEAVDQQYMSFRARRLARRFRLLAVVRRRLGLMDA
ncbi:hypothetical protein [Vitiosangium sp. GDMCC 1.1324]|uniref:hypothetical protein n=1 Tax=Vitiosangium sp. (strain GDMCC 1.1324) TaxID=2138576 RepID=UPI000D35C96C|nr:hypothetical protein [Vitiosangium sp. GDMCC 1.1324]PTL82548.1 hypothetical protein DAT35_17250 [Vitiosangium sp. GDMCC 1.1324]